MSMLEIVREVLNSGNNYNYPNILWEVSQKTGIPVSDDFAEQVHNCIMRIRWFNE